MNKDCEKYFDSIEALVEGEIPDEQNAARVESHIFDCAVCRNEYELLREEKEALAHCLFEFEPPADSWANFQARLNEEATASSNVAAAETAFRPKKGIFVFGFSPALAAFAGLLLILGIGFVLIKKSIFEKTDDIYVAETKAKDSQSNEINQQSKPDLRPNNAAAKNNESHINKPSLKTTSNSLFDKKSPAVETVKINRKSVVSSERKNPKSGTELNDEERASALRTQNLETEIAGQIEQVEMVLRSFRNAQANATVAGFDVEYEKKQARKLLAQNARLRREAEDYGISYAEELLSRVEPYLLDIANLENNPSADRVLDIKERVASQNIIASLQMYKVVATR